MKKKVIYVILLFVMMLTVASCGSESSGWHDDLLKSVGNKMEDDDSESGKNSKYEIASGKQADFELTDR